MTQARALKACGIVDVHQYDTKSALSESDLSMQTLLEDVLQVLSLMLARMGTQNLPCPLVLIGHSLGGAILVRAMAEQSLENVRAVVLVEACEVNQEVKSATCDDVGLPKQQRKSGLQLRL